MRILVVHPGPEFSVSDVYEGYAEGLHELGHTVRGFNLNDRLAFYSNVELEGAQLELDDAATLVNKHLLAKCYEFAPDIIVVISGFFITSFTWQLWRKRNSKIVSIFTESPYEEDKQLTTVNIAEPDLVVVNDPIHLDRYRQHGIKAHYIPHSYRAGFHTPQQVKQQYDFAFVGTGYESRIKFFEQVNWHKLRVGLAGHWPDLEQQNPIRNYLIPDQTAGIDNERTRDIYRSTTISANLYRGGRGYTGEANRADLTNGWAIGPREVELAATETFFLREPRGEGDILFPQLPTFTNPQEFAEQLLWWNKHQDERQAAITSAKAAIIDRTFTNAARRLIALLD